jgi:hypothetical protein
MTDKPDTEDYEALGIALDMVMAKYRDDEATIITDRVAAFVTSGPTNEDDGRRMGMICQHRRTARGRSR